MVPASLELWREKNNKTKTASINKNCIQIQNILQTNKNICAYTSNELLAIRTGLFPPWHTG